MAFATNPAESSRHRLACSLHLGRRHRAVQLECLVRLLWDTDDVRCELAEELSVEMFSITAELVSTHGQSSLWQDFIEQLKGVYSGQFSGR